MELWYTEEWTDNVRFSIKVDNHLFSDKSEFQQVDVFEINTRWTYDGKL